MLGMFNMKGRMSQSVSALALWPVNLQSYPINYTYYIKKIYTWIYILYTTKHRWKRTWVIWILQSKAWPCSSLNSSWFCRISCKEEENFLWFYEKDCFVRLALSPFRGLFYSPLCQNQSIKCFKVHSHFVRVKCIFFSLLC